MTEIAERTSRSWLRTIGVGFGLFLVSAIIARIAFLYSWGDQYHYTFFRQLIVAQLFFPLTVIPMYNHNYPAMILIAIFQWPLYAALVFTGFLRRRTKRYLQLVAIIHIIFIVISLLYYCGGPWPETLA